MMLSVAWRDTPARRDVRATLIELDDHNVRAARERVAAAGLPKVEVIEGDACTTDIYQGHVPAQIVLVCGLFGNLSDADIRRTIRHLPMLCTERASVLWTRGGYLAEQIRSWFLATGGTAKAVVREAGGRSAALRPSPVASRGRRPAAAPSPPS
jgi:hypothetical protein